MALIKHAHSGTAAQDAIVLDLGDLRQEAQRIRQRAQREAQQIVEDARRERERLVATAHDEGLAKGRAEGLEAGCVEGREQGVQEVKSAHAQRLEQLASSLAASIDRIEKAREEMLQQARADVLEFALAVAERVTRRAVELDTETALRQVDACLALVLKPTTLVIGVHPDDRASIEAALPALLDRFGRAASAELVEDPALLRGSATVRTAYGRIDARIDEQIARIAASVRPPPPDARAAVRPISARTPAADASSADDADTPDDGAAQEGDG